MTTTQPIATYLEVGQKRTFAGAIEWPGWCRSARDEATARRALLDYAPRYARALGAAALGFDPPADIAAYHVAERLPGDMSTDFGAPAAAPSADQRPVDEAELARLGAILAASWQEFDRIVASAEGRELRQGPRGGGREVEGIELHVVNAEAAYLRRLAWQLRHPSDAPLADRRELTRHAALDALASAVRDGLPERGPRGGTIWTPRYFVRRVAWHVLDHAWEIEDRVI